MNIFSFELKRQRANSRVTFQLRLAAFRALERFSAWLRPSPAGALSPPPDSAHPAAASLWVFASTIGEINAIEPFLRRVMEELGNPALTLISDRSIYNQAYLAKFPTSHVEQLDGSTRQVQRLTARRPPLMLMLAEIPALLHDAPCRFSFAAVQAAREAGAPVILVNGWLYGYAPPSRLDRIEKRLFARAYAAAFDLAFVQTTGVRNRLIRAGANPKAVHVTGNLKFDAMAPMAVDPRASDIHAALVRRQAAFKSTVIVAGSVTETSHQQGIVDSFVQFQQTEPGAFLVLAPRHPEDQPRMAALRALLERSALDCRFRSEGEAAYATAGDVMVLDTMGELQGCYAAADLAFVGVDHNVLEPLAFGKPVFVCDEWEPTYPSYPVYTSLLQHGGLQRVSDYTELGAAWTTFRVNQRAGLSGSATAQRTETVLAGLRGACEKNILLMRQAGMFRRAPHLKPDATLFL